MAERFNAPVLKTGEGATPPRVRISLSPPFKNDFLALVPGIAVIQTKTKT